MSRSLRRVLAFAIASITVVAAGPVFTAITVGAEGYARDQGRRQRKQQRAEEDQPRRVLEKAVEVVEAAADRPHRAARAFLNHGQILKRHTGRGRRGIDRVRHRFTNRHICPHLDFSHAHHRLE